MPGAPTRASAGFFAAGDLTTMSILKRLFGARDDRVALRPLYATIVERGRDPAWYAQGGVPDTLDGRFDMVATMLSLVLIRLEREGDPGRLPSTLLTEIFVEDMDGQLRQLGIGDIIVGKHIGKMMAALGGRLGAYREAGAGETGLEDALIRNLWRGAPGADARPSFVAQSVGRFERDLARVTMEDILAGDLPGLVYA